MSFSSVDELKTKIDKIKTLIPKKTDDWPAVFPNCVSISFGPNVENPATRIPLQHPTRVINTNVGFLIKYKTARGKSISFSPKAAFVTVLLILLA